MAKKSKSRKRKTAQKKAQSRSAVQSSSAAKKPTKKASTDTTEVREIDNHLGVEVEPQPRMTKAPQEAGSHQKLVVAALAVLILVLVGCLVYFYSQTQKATTELQQTTQDELLKVNEASGDSLGPAAGSDAANPQESTTPGGGGSGTELQPTDPNTSEQLQ